jgi:hypothetical protein
VRISVTKEGTYVPEWKGNRELPEAERIVVSYCNLSSDERSRYEKKGEMKVIVPDVFNAKDPDIEKAVNKAAEGEYTPGATDVAAMTRAMKPQFKNFELEDGTPIRTWADFLKLPVTRNNGLQALRAEIERELPNTQEPIPEDDAKN